MSERNQRGGGHPKGVPTGAEIDYRHLRDCLARAVAEGTPQETIASETGLSKGTIGRVLNADLSCDAETLVRLVRWLRIPLDRFLIRKPDAAHYPVLDRPLPDICDRLLDSDPKLSEDGRARLKKLFRATYEAMRE